MTASRINDITVKVEIDGALFPEQVLFKCFYWYAASYSVNIDRTTAGFSVQLESLEGDISDERLEHLSKKIKADLIDYKTRDLVQAETYNIKQMLIAKAFSAADEFDESPKGEVNDPVGFKID